jgi:hypothetical protein
MPVANAPEPPRDRRTDASPRLGEQLPSTRQSPRLPGPMRNAATQGTGGPKRTACRGGCRLRAGAGSRRRRCRFRARRRTPRSRTAARGRWHRLGLAPVRFRVLLRHAAQRGLPRTVAPEGDRWCTIRRPPGRPADGERATFPRTWRRAVCTAHRSLQVPPRMTATLASVAPTVAPPQCDIKKRCQTTENRNPSRINELGFWVGPCGTSGNVPGPRHMWSIITWKSHLSPRRITLRPRWHPPSPVKGPSIGIPPTFIGGARCTFVTWPNTEQDRRQCSSTAHAVKPLEGCSSRNEHRPPLKRRSASAGRLRRKLHVYRGNLLAPTTSELLDGYPAYRTARSG